MEIVLIFLLYCLIGVIVEFLLMFSVLIYAKRHSNSDEQLIEAWNNISDLIIMTSLFRTTDIRKGIADTLQLNICVWTLIWPVHVFINILIIIGFYIFKLINCVCYKLTSVLVKR